MQEVVQLERVSATWLRGKLPSAGVLGSASLEFPSWKMAVRVNAESTKVAAVFIFGPLSLLACGQQFLRVNAECNLPCPDPHPRIWIWNNHGDAYLKIFPPKHNLNCLRLYTERNSSFEFLLQSSNRIYIIYVFDLSFVYMYLKFDF